MLVETLIDAKMEIEQPPTQLIIGKNYFEAIDIGITQAI